MLRDKAFVAAVQRDKDSEYCRVWPGAVMACDSVMAAYAPIEQDLSCCPHTEKLLFQGLW